MNEDKKMSDEQSHSSPEDENQISKHSSESQKSQPKQAKQQAPSRALNPLMMAGPLAAGDRDHQHSRKSAGSGARRFREVNIRLFLISLIALIVLIGGVHGVHLLQAKRTATDLRDRARQLQEQGEPKKAARYLTQYLAYEPENTEATAELAEILYKTAEKPRDYFRALMAMEKVVRMDPDRYQIRRDLVDLLLKFPGRSQDALEHLDFLHRKFPEDGVLHYKEGICHQLENKYTQATKSYRQSIELTPSSLESYIALALLLRQQFQQPGNADTIIDQMVSDNSHLMHAYLERARYLQTFGQTEDAASDIAIAHEMSPADVDVLLLAANVIATGLESEVLDANKIQTRLQQQVKKNPENVQIYYGLSLLSRSLGDVDQANQWLISGLKRVPDDLSLATELAQAWIRAGRFDDARKQIEQLKLAKLPVESTDYLEALILLEEKHWSKARAKLENVVNRTNRSHPLSAAANLQLGRTFRALRDIDSEIAAYRRILEVQPDRSDIRMRLADALALSGKIDDALGYYRAEKKTQATVMSAARLILIKTLKSPKEKRNWSEFQSAINAMEKSQPDSVESKLLQIILFEQTEQFDKVQTVLKEGREKHPDDLRFWIGLSEFAEKHEQNSQKAQDILAEAFKKFGERIELKVHRISLQLRSDSKQSLTALRAAEEELKSLSGEEQSQLKGRLASAYKALNHHSDSLRLWKELSVTYPENLDIQTQIFEMAALLKDADSVKGAIDHMQEIEGPKGLYWRSGEAAWLIQQARASGSPASISRAKLLLSEIEKQNPAWPRLFMNKGQISEFEKKPDEAITNYQRALEVEKNLPDVVERLSYLLVLNNKPAEANRVIQDFEASSPVPLGYNFCFLAARIAFQSGDKQRSLKLAKCSTSGGTENYQKHLLLAQILTNLKQFDEAGQSFRQTVEIDKSQSASWLALVSHLSRQNQQAEARKAIAEAEKNIAPKDAAITLALCYEAVGNMEQAANKYLSAVSIQPENVAVLQRVASFFLRTGQVEKAEPLLDQLTSNKVDASPKEIQWAYRQKATVLGSQDYQKFLAAIEILNKNLEEHPQSTEDLLLKARLLAKWPRPAHLREAIRIFRLVEQKNDLDIPTQLVLFNLFDQARTDQLADARWKKLLADNSENSAIIIAYLRRALAKGQNKAATVWLARLVKLNPNRFETVELQSRFLVAEEKNSAALKMLDSFVSKIKTPEALIQSLAQVASLVDELAQQAGKSSDSAKILTQAALVFYEALDKKLPNSSLRYAGFLARQKQSDRALEICELLLNENQGALLTGTVISIGRSADLNTTQRVRVEKLVEQISEKYPNDSAVQWQLASFDVTQGNSEQGVVRYRHVLEHNPNHVIALNNLAWLLSHGTAANLVESKKLIQNAIDLAGPSPQLLDTQATILTVAGENQKAVEVLQTAIEETDTSLMQFHLAVAYWKMKNRSAAKFHFEKALKTGLAEDDLHDLEKTNFQNLVTQLGSS